MKILALATSRRADSYNRRLLRLAIDVARAAGAEVDDADFREFDIPIFDSDLAAQGYPPGVMALMDRIRAADGFILAAPEYNFSVSGPTKNAVDWVSDARPIPFRGKTGLLIAASTTMVGGVRGLWQLRVPLEGCGALLHPDMFALARAQDAFTPEGALVDEKLAGRLAALVESYVRIGTALVDVEW